MGPLELMNPSAAGAVGPRQSGNVQAAQTRFNNDRIKAKRQGLNQSAQNAMPLQNNVKQGLRAPMQNRSAPRGDITNLVSNVGVGDNRLNPVGVNQAPVEPQVSLEDMEADSAFEYFLSSPQLQQAISTAKLRQYFKRDNPAGAEATLAMDVVQSMLSR